MTGEKELFVWAQLCLRGYCIQFQELSLVFDLTFFFLRKLLALQLLIESHFQSWPVAIPVRNIVVSNLNRFSICLRPEASLGINSFLQNPRHWLYMQLGQLQTLEQSSLIPVYPGVGKKASQGFNLCRVTHSCVEQTRSPPVGFQVWVQSGRRESPIRQPSQPARFPIASQRRYKSLGKEVVRMWSLLP